MLRATYLTALFCVLNLGHMGFAVPLTVGSYNLHNLENSRGLENDLKQLAFVDVWGFQEVMFNGEEVVPSFTSLLPKSANFVVTKPIANVQPEISQWEGHAIASRYPIEKSGVIPLTPALQKNRSALYAIININGLQLLFVNTDHDVDLFKIGYQERRANVDSLLRGIANLHFNGPIVIVGDFNTTDSYPNWSRGLRGWQEVQLTQQDFKIQGWETPTTAESDSFTFESFGITQQLDHLFFKGILKYSRWYRFNQRTGSDHFPIFAEVSLP